MGLYIDLPLAIGYMLLMTLCAKSVNFYNSTCEDPECQRAANRILMWLNPSVNPCDDFYQFTCGQHLTIEEAASHVKRQYYDLKKVLEEPPLITEDSHYLKQIRQFYSMCKDKDQIAGRGVSPALTLLRQLGQWPLLDQSWSEDDWRLEEAMSGLLWIGLGEGFLKLSVKTGGDSDKYLLSIDAINTDKDGYETTSASFKEKLAKEINVGVTKLKISEKIAELFYKALSEVLSFDEDEDELDHDTSSKENDDEECNEVIEGDDVDTVNDVDNCNDENNQLFTVSDLQDRYPWLNWRTLLAGVLSPAGVTLKDDDVMIVESPDKLDRLGLILQAFPKRVIANYLMWYAFNKMEKDLIVDVNQNQNRWLFCLNQVIKSWLSYAVTSQIARKTPKDDPLIISTWDLAVDIRDQLLSELEGVTWMDDLSKERVQQKISATKFHIGYPPELWDDDLLNILYKELNITGNNYFESKIGVKKGELKLSYGLLTTPGRENGWTFENEYDNINEFNAYNYREMNSVRITGPELFYRDIYNTKVPSYIAYGDVGSTLGHELIHSLDNEGLLFNTKGHYNEDWMTEETWENFTQRAQCIIDQYSSVNLTTELKIDGEKTQSETISDNGGLKVAYHAYRRAANLQGTEPGLPHLEHYTPDQLFFITAANSFCEISEETKLRLEAIKNGDTHPPQNSRVNGMMMNSRSFSEAFNCGKDDVMNPPDKCEVW